MSCCHRLAPALALLALSTASVHAADLSLCRPDERPLFACATGNGKQVALCGSADLSSAAGSLQYRFGRPDAVELAQPAPGADWRALTRAGRVMYSGGGGAWLAIANGPYRYVVYSAIGRGWGIREGLVVQKNGRQVAHLPCQGETVSELGSARFADIGITEDEQEFELP